MGSARRITLYTKPGVEYNRLNLEAFVYQQAGNAIAAEIICMGGLAAFGEKAMKDISQLPAKYKVVIQQAKAAALASGDQKGK